MGSISFFRAASPSWVGQAKSPTGFSFLWIMIRESAAAQHFSGPTPYDLQIQTTLSPHTLTCRGTYLTNWVQNCLPSTTRFFFFLKMSDVEKLSFLMK